MDLFIKNFMLFLEIHFGKQIFNAPLRWWIDRTEGTYKEVRILNNFNTIVFGTGTKSQMLGKNRQPYYVLNRNEVGVKVDPDTGKVSMWKASQTNKKAKGRYEKCNYHTVMEFALRFASYPSYQEFIDEVPAPVIPLLDEFLAYHNAESLESLVIPAAAAFGIVSDAKSYDRNLTGQERTPWMDFALGARTLDEFWTRMGKTVKLAKDEKRALVALIKHDAKYLSFARMATRISIPNIRTLTVPVAKERNGLWGRAIVEEPWTYMTPNSDMVNTWMMGLRKVVPNRRVMFLQNWGREAMDTLNMLAELRRAGLVDEMNFRSVHEYHEQATLQSKQLRTMLRPIPDIKVVETRREINEAGTQYDVKEKVSIHGVMIPGTDIKVVVPQDTHEVVAWGELQNHCIGSYAGYAAEGRSKLLGFKRGDEWVGHASISGKHCEQLLARHNKQLPQEDKSVILNWMKAVDLINKNATGWG